MDIVEWLRDYYHMDSRRYSNVQIADEIERLREALKKISEPVGPEHPNELIRNDSEIIAIASSALQQKDSE